MVYVYGYIYMSVIEQKDLLLYSSKSNNAVKVWNFYITCVSVRNNFYEIYI